MRPLAWAAAGLLAAAAPGLEAQLAERVRSTEEGVLRLRYDTRPDVAICEQGVRMGERNVWWRSRGWDDEPEGCSWGEAEVELRVVDGAVRGVEIVHGPGDRMPGAEELGRVPAEAVADFLLGVARDDRASRRAARDAIFPAVIADVDGIWTELLVIARDRRVDEEAREQAIFWLGQGAADAVTEGLAEVALDGDEEQEIRDAAVFALSRRPNDEGVPVLMELARTADESKTRRTAMFWLAQAEDERVLRFFEEILLRRRRAN